MKITIEPPYNENATKEELQLSLSELRIKARDINNSLRMYTFIEGTPLGKYLFSEKESGKVFEYCSMTLYSSKGSLMLYEEGIRGANQFSNQTIQEDYITDEFVKALVEVFISLLELSEDVSNKFKYTKGDFHFYYEPELEGSTLSISTEMTSRVRAEKRHQLMGILLDIDDIEQRIVSFKRSEGISSSFWKKD